MKEFVLTQPYNSLDEMLKSGEVAVYKEELEQGDIEKYAIVSRIGNRYDLNGKKIEEFAKNPFFKKKEENVVELVETKIVNEDARICEEKEEEVKMSKYYEIEKLIDEEIEVAIVEIEEKYEKEIALLKEEHAKELAKVKSEVKAELLAKLNS